MQTALHNGLQRRNPHCANQGEIIAYQGPEIPYTAILHAVAVDAWYHSTTEIVQELIRRCLEESVNYGARKVSLTALATGFGDLTLPQFANALHPLMQQVHMGIEEICICLPEVDRELKLKNLLFGPSIK